jgi:hypothetical protein
MDNDHPKLDMDSILPVDTEKITEEPVEEENEEEIIDDATMKAAAAFASDELTPSVWIPLPGAYHVAPSPTAAEVATAARQGRASSFNRSLINTYTEDHHDDHDDSATILVPTASVVQEKELYAGRIVEAAPWEDPMDPLEAMDSSNNPLPKDAVWIGRKRAIIYSFVVFVVIAGLITGLTTALIRSEGKEKEGASASLSSFDKEGASASLSSFDNSETLSPSSFRPLSRPPSASPPPSPSASPSTSSDGDDQLDEVDDQAADKYDDDES